MPIVTQREQVLGIYREAAEKGWVLPCFCSENLTTTEAVLDAALRHADRIGFAGLPVIVAITCRYGHRSQAVNYTHTRQWDIGLRLFLSDLEVLAGPDSPYRHLRVMVHLDHIQFDDDQALLSWDFSRFSSIMFDASKRPFDENIRLTSAFMRARGHEIVVEGACDEIYDATGAEHGDLTTPERAERFCAQTGVDLIVANLGTEHRASGADLTYHREAARQIRARIGSRIVLHGASSVPVDRIARLSEDGVCKVNLWTALERDASPVLFEWMVRNASATAGKATAAKLKQEGLLGEAAVCTESADLSHFTTVARQERVFGEMVRIASECFAVWMR